MSQGLQCGTQKLGKPRGLNPNRQLTEVETALLDDTVGAASESSRSGVDNDPNRAITLADHQAILDREYVEPFLKYASQHSNISKDSVNVWKQGLRAWCTFAKASTKSETQPIIRALAYSHDSISQKEWDTNIFGCSMLIGQLILPAQAAENLHCNTIGNELTALFPLSNAWMDEVERVRTASQSGGTMAQSDRWLSQYADSHVPNLEWIADMRKGTAMYQDYRKQKATEVAQSADNQSSLPTAGDTESEAPTASVAADNEVETSCSGM